MRACKNGHSKIVKVLLEVPGIDVNAIDVSIAIFTPSSSFPVPYPLSILSLTNHASYHTCCCSLQISGNTGLHLACGFTNCHKETVKILLQSPAINVNHTDVSIILSPFIPFATHVIIAGDAESH